MLSSSQDTLLKESKTIYPKKLFGYECVTLYSVMQSDRNNSKIYTSRRYNFCTNDLVLILKAHIRIRV